MKKDLNWVSLHVRYNKFKGHKLLNQVVAGHLTSVQNILRPVKRNLRHTSPASNSFIHIITTNMHLWSQVLVSTGTLELTTRWHQSKTKIKTTVPDAINRPKHAWKGDYNTGKTRAQILTRGWSCVIIPELTQSHRPVLCTVHITACDRVWARVIIGQKPQHHRSIIGIVASSSWSTPIKYYQLAMWSTWIPAVQCTMSWILGYTNVPGQPSRLICFKLELECFTISMIEHEFFTMLTWSIQSSFVRQDVPQVWITDIV